MRYACTWWVTRENYLLPFSFQTSAVGSSFLAPLCHIGQISQISRHLLMLKCSVPLAQFKILFLYPIQSISHSHQPRPALHTRDWTLLLLLLLHTSSHFILMLWTSPRSGSERRGKWWNHFFLGIVDGSSLAVVDFHWVAYFRGSART